MEFITVYVIVAYLVVVLALGLGATFFSRGTSADYIAASRTTGPVLLLLSLFGTTMTAFAMVGSTGEAYELGIGAYGKMASWSGLIHSACFFLVGIRVWAMGKRHGYLTQIELFRARFENNFLGVLLFPCIVGMSLPYIIIGLMGGGSIINAMTAGLFPEVFSLTRGGIPPWLTNLSICGVVLTYVFFGGQRGAVWANALQTTVFMVAGLITFWLIATRLGGLRAATQMAEESHLAREGHVGHMEFFSYCLVPLSVGMFPHIFQNWLVAKSAKSFRLTVIAHPVFIMIIWMPCIMIGLWASGALLNGARVVPPTADANAVLGFMVKKLTDPFIAGLLGAGILAAIMGGLDMQFMCLGAMFTNDIVVNHYGKARFSDTQQIWMTRGFTLVIGALSYWLSLSVPRSVFSLGVWCFSGFASLFPLILATFYWKRTTAAGAIACVVSTAAVWFVLFRNSNYGAAGEQLVLGLMPVVWIMAASVASLVAVSLLTSPPSQATIDKFFPKTLERT